MKLGIIGPCEPEIAPFIQKMDVTATEHQAKLTFHSGTYAGTNLVAVFCGVCKVNAAIAAQLLISQHQVTHMLVVGVAGAIDENLAIADTIVSSETAYHDVADGILTQYHPWMKTVYFTSDKTLTQAIMAANADDPSVSLGRIVTGEAFIEQEGRDTIIKNHRPLCVDMETAAIAHVCHANDIPFAAIRSVSDTPHESGTAAFERYMQQAANKSIAVLCRYLDANK